MKLKDLIGHVESPTVKGNADIEVCAVAYNSASVTKGSCFVALRGAKTDGHTFISEAVARGASCIVCEKQMPEAEEVTSVIVKNSRRALAVISAAFFNEPSKPLTLVGITGTNGKTTITYLLEAIFAAADLNPGIIGTVEYRFAGIAEPAPHTTPESYEVQKLLSRMRDASVRACAMEVSSHSLAQERVVGCHFDAAVFTNLTPEHLDYHKDMEAYFASKAILFEDLLAASCKKSPFAAINVDDSMGEELVRRCGSAVVRYALNSKAQVSGSDLSFDARGLKMTIDSPAGSFKCQSHLCGRFNAMNILAAVAVATKLGIDTKTIAEALTKIRGVPGRFESIENSRGLLALVDYAHTPDALNNVLTHARELIGKGRSRVITVFGCGGDRDRTKRPIMGRVAAKLSDVAIVTSDNPRTEKPLAIIDEILPGVIDEKPPLKNGHGYEVIEDRRKAIERAVEIAKEGDVIVVAGKGHEDYQIIGTKRHHFDDREILREILK